MCAFSNVRQKTELTGDIQGRAFHPSLLHQALDGLELRHELVLLFPSHRLHAGDKNKATAIYWQGQAIATQKSNAYIKQNSWLIPCEYKPVFTQGVALMPETKITWKLATHQLVSGSSCLRMELSIFSVCASLCSSSFSWFSARGERESTPRSVF